MPSDPSRTVSKQRSNTKRSIVPPEPFLIGERVQIASTVKPKKYAGKRGEIESINENEFCVTGAWFKGVELSKI